MNSRSTFYKIVCCSVIATMLLSLSVNAQQISRKRSAMNKADRYYSYFKYRSAIKQYTIVLKKDTNNYSAIYGLGNCYLQLSNYSSALVNYNKLKDVWADSAQFMYKYVQTLRATGKYEEAGKNDDNYLSRHPDDDTMQKLAAQLKLVNNFYKDSLNWNIGFLNINSRYSDYSPVLLENSLVFVSTRPSGKSRTHADKDYYSNLRNSSDFARIYNVKDTGNIVTQLINGNQIPKVKTEEELRYLPISLLDEKRMNAGPVTFSKDGTRVYYTVNTKFKDHTSWLGIVGANYKNGTITDSKLFAYNEKQYSVEHPALSPDGRYLYFSSNKPGGVGAFDLYSCETDGSGKNWLTPQNLGSLVNTGGNEMFPYVDKENNLYFASDGLAGLGGLDLFYVKMKDGFPLEAPKNLGYPLNSSFDDFGITTATNGNSGYFSSNRREENDDIYRFDAVQSNVTIYIKGTVFDEETKLRVRGVTLDFQDSTGKTTKLTSDSAGNFNITLTKETVLNAKTGKEGYHALLQQLHTEQLVPYHFMSLFLKSDKDSDQSIAAVRNNKNDDSFKGDLEHLADSLQQTIEKRYIVHHAFDSSAILEEDKDVLDNVASSVKEHPELYVIVASFTDCHGNLVYNDKLSKKRSAFVRRYLRNKGLTDKNINTEYFGKKHLVLPCKEDKNFNRQSQQSNRRTEIIITKDKNEKWHSSDTRDNTVINKAGIQERTSANATRKVRRQKEKLSKRRSASVSRNSQKKGVTDKNKIRVQENTPGTAIENNAAIAVTNESTISRVVPERSRLEEILLHKISGRINNEPIFVETVSDSVSIALYDNGVFDHDSVSVVYNNKMLTNKQLLNVDKAITFHLKIDEEQKNNKLVFYADNLGDISPNSCLMLVTDGIKRTEIPVTTDLNHNTIVVFMKRKMGKVLGFVRF